MPQELRITHPETHEQIVAVSIPDEMYSGRIFELIEKAKELGAITTKRAMKGHDLHPEELSPELFDVDGANLIRVALPTPTLERYDDEPGRGY